MKKIESWVDGKESCFATFDILAEAQEFLLKGIELEDTNPDIWWDILVVQTVYLMNRF